MDSTISGPTKLETEISKSFNIEEEVVQVEIEENVAVTRNQYYMRTRNAENQTQQSVCSGDSYSDTESINVRLVDGPYVPRSNSSSINQRRPARVPQVIRIIAEEKPYNLSYLIDADKVNDPDEIQRVKNLCFVWFAARFSNFATKTQILSHIKGMSGTALLRFIFCVSSLYKNFFKALGDQT